MSDAATFVVSEAAPQTSEHVWARALARSVLLVALASPFELALPGAAAGGFELTSLELVVFLAGLTAVVAWVANPGLLIRTAAARGPIALAAVVWLAVVATSALAAPEFRGNALRAAGRLGAAAGVVAMASSALTSPTVARALVRTLVFVGAAVGLVAVFEAAQVPAVMQALTAFRPGFHVVGGQMRATSTLIYPTIASMYLEVVFALGLAVLVRSHRSPTPDSRLPTPDTRVFVALVLVGAGIVATFTRAGLISLAVSLALAVAVELARSRSGRHSGLGVLRSWVPGARFSRPQDLRTPGLRLRALTALAVVLTVLVFASRSPHVLLLRFGTDTAQDWYGARYQVPSRLSIGPGEFADVPVTLTNTGLLQWQSDVDPPFRVSYHWLRADTEDVVQFDGLRTPFPRPVAPRERVTVAARVRAPGYPGEYVLVWDVVQEHRTWLSVEGVQPGRSTVIVEGPPVDGPPKSLGRLPGASNRLPRPTLWKAALAIAGDHSVLGIGPDNFRLTYGRPLGLASWDTRVHANNMYLETLAGSGALGLGALVWLLAAVALEIRRRWSRVSAEDLPLLVGATAAGVSMAGHGLVDSFLTFTPAYVIFALALGLALSPALNGRSRGDRHQNGENVAVSAMPSTGGRDRLQALQHFRGSEGRSPDRPGHAHRV
jgi:hypothetical protein